MDKWMNVQVDEWTSGRMDKWMNGQVDEWASGSMYVCMLVSYYASMLDNKW